METRGSVVLGHWFAIINGVDVFILLAAFVGLNCLQSFLCSYLMKKAGVCCLCEQASRKRQGYQSHCYWVNLCLLFVIEGSVNDGTFSIWFLKLFRFLNVNEYTSFHFKISLKPDDKSQFEVFLPIPFISSGG